MDELEQKAKLSALQNFEVGELSDEELDLLRAFRDKKMNEQAKLVEQPRMPASIFQPNLDLIENELPDDSGENVPVDPSIFMPPTPEIANPELLEKIRLMRQEQMR